MDTHALVTLPDRDYSLSAVRSLQKDARDRPERRRTVPNVFATLSGRAQPRQGFLSLEVMRSIYLRSELIRACVDTLIELVSAVSWNINPIDEDRSAWLKKKRPEEYLDQQHRIEWLRQFFRGPNDYESLNTFHRRFLRDLLIFDAGAYELVMAEYDNGVRLPLELGIVAGDTVEVECDRQGLPTGYWQSRNVLHNVSFAREELAYVMLNPCSWQPYGISPIETAWLSICNDLSALQYNNSYFAKNGVPPGLLAVIGVSEQQFRSLMAQMRQTSGDNPFNLHAFRANRNPDGGAQKVFEHIPLESMSNREMQFKELLDLCVNRITMAYKLSPSMIGFTDQVTGGIGSGVAETQEDLMQNKAVGPLLREVAATHTTHVIHNGCGWEDLEYTFSQSSTPQEEVEYQRSIQEVQMGLKTINEHRSQYGGRKSVDWGDQPLQAPQGYQPPQSPEQMQQQMQQQMGGPPGGQPPNPMTAMQKAANKKRIIITL